MLTLGRLLHRPDGLLLFLVSFFIWSMTNVWKILFEEYKLSRWRGREGPETNVAFIKNECPSRRNSEEKIQSKRQRMMMAILPSRVNKMASLFLDARSANRSARLVQFPQMILALFMALSIESSWSSTLGCPLSAIGSFCVLESDRDECTASLYPLCHIRSTVVLYWCWSPWQMDRWRRPRVRIKANSLCPDWWHWVVAAKIKARPIASTITTTD